jgi:hypothetical protein
MFKRIKSFFCWIGWHGPHTMKGYDGCSVHAQCDWCGFQGMIDSQGNLF